MSRQKFTTGCDPHMQGDNQAPRGYREARDLHINVASAPEPASEPPILVMDRMLESSIDMLSDEVDRLCTRLARALKEPYPTEDGAKPCMPSGKSPLAQALLRHASQVDHVTYLLRRLLDRLEL